MFLCANCLSICLVFFLFLCVWVGGGWVGLCVCVCVQITPEPMNRSLLKKLWVGPD